MINTTTVFACGDVFISKNSIFWDETLENKINESDIAICNFEAPIVTNEAKLIKAGPNLQQPKFSINLLKQLGFTHFNLANNHIMDYGKKALFKTINELKKHKINFFGAGMSYQEASKLNITEVNNLKIGIIGIAESDFDIPKENDDATYFKINDVNLKSLIKNYKEKVDFLIACTHAGIENIDLPIPIWRDQYKEIIDCGVDIIIGSHPHVPQGYEKYKHGIIFYSLGNFMFQWGTHNTNNLNSYSIKLNLTKGQKIKFEIIEHTRIENKLKIKHNSCNINQLNKLINNNYKKNIDKEINYLYSNLYKHYLNYTILGFNFKQSIFKIIKRIISQLLFKRKNSILTNTLQYSLFNNESNRYVIRKALENKINKINYKNEYK